jgi:hypothetical protein
MIEPSDLSIVKDFAGFNENGEHSLCILLSLSLPFIALLFKFNVSEHFLASAHMFRVIKHYSTSEAFEQWTVFEAALTIPI